MERVRQISADGGDAHHRRRLLVQDLADLLATADAGGPFLILLEDLHWADELSLDVIAHLAGRLAARVARPARRAAPGLAWAGPTVDAEGARAVFGELSGRKCSGSSYHAR
jgi:hypothetical protein